MTKFWKIAFGVLLSLALLGTLVTVVCFRNFLSSGVHRFMGYTRLDIQQKVYFINANTDEVTGSSVLTISGIIQPSKKGLTSPFLGVISVASHPVNLEQSYNWFSALDQEGAIHITNLHTDNDIEYWLQMSSKDPDIFVIMVYLEDGTILEAYPGQTEQEAIANCQAFWEGFPW